jgi:hypothetical protein
MKNKIYKVTERLPDQGQKCKCFGYKTLCCQSDMDEIRDWHDVTFNFLISTYKLKNKIPEDPEETILEESSVIEKWECGPNFEDGFIIGVTEWSSDL